MNRNKYKNSYGLITEEEQFRVNTEHKLTEEQAVFLPMHRKLSRYFAQNICDQEIDKFVDLFDQTAIGDFDIHEQLKKIAEEDEMNMQKKNQMTAIDKMKSRVN